MVYQFHSFFTVIDVFLAENVFKYVRQKSR